MEKKRINMVGGPFQHEICSSAGNVPKFLEWDKTGRSNISIHIDFAIFQIPVNKNKRNYAWILESAEFYPQVSQWVSSHISYIEENFDLLFTCDKRLIPLSNKIKFCLPNAVPWIKDRKIHDKSKLISMIASTKAITSGHRYRQQVLEKYKSQMDCFGTGRNYIEKKEYGLNDYYFSIAVLNANYPIYFTDIVTDCFATGAIPIYWGTPDIKEIFNNDGIITLTDDFKIEDLSKDLYFSKMDYVKDNFERVIHLPIAEDYIFKNYIN